MNSILYNQPQVYIFPQVHDRGSFKKQINEVKWTFSIPDYWMWTSIVNPKTAINNHITLYTTVILSVDDTQKLNECWFDANQAEQIVNSQFISDCNYWLWRQPYQHINNANVHNDYCNWIFNSLNYVDNTFLKQKISHNINKDDTVFSHTNWFGHQEINKEDSECVVKISLTDDLNVNNESIKAQRILHRSTKRSSHLKLRNDVVFKTIFRCFRKHYIKDFKRHFDFVKHRDSDRVFASKVREYLVSHFGFKSELLANVFVCVIDTKQKYYQVSDTQVSAKINELMYNFSNNRMLELLDCAEFALILKSFEALCYLNMRDNLNIIWIAEFSKSFLVQDNIVNKILKNRSDRQLIKTYQKQINNLMSINERN